jgi:Xaa-Pro aminopeptidase
MLARYCAAAALAACLCSGVVRAQVLLPEYAARRAALSQLAGDGAIAVIGGAEPAQDYNVFVPSTAMRYLTGWTSPDAAVLLVREHGVVRETLFVPLRNPAQEVWTGVRPSLREASRLSGMPARDIAEFSATCDSMLDAQTTLRVIGEMADVSAVGVRGVTPAQGFMDGMAKRHPTATLMVANPLVLQLRAQKSEAELALLRASIDITVRAHEETMRMLAPGMNEFEVQALVEYTFRRNGAERPGFASIVGSGDNATTLHYWRNDRVMQPGELMVLDIGSSYGGYSADVTRTMPVSGRFTTEQRAIYELVRQAQVAGEKATRVGAKANESSLAASGVLAKGLAALGLMQSATATYDCDKEGTQCSQLRLFYMHGLGHGIGLDVHDPDVSDAGVWTAGSVVTIEPGIYVRRNLAEAMHVEQPKLRALRQVLGRIRGAVTRYAGIGVRIEDDYLLTDAGLEWLSRLPREASEVEAALTAPRAAGPGARDAGLVGRYPRGGPH